MTLPWTTVALLALAGFSAGLVDSIAGGGGLIAVPALLAAGLPPHLALGTNKGQATWGTVTSSISYARRGYVDGPRAKVGFVLGVLGALLGATAQLAVRPDVLRPVVIALLLAAAAIVSWPRRPHERPRAIAHAREIGAAVAFLLGAYDGFFGPGVGTMLLVGNVVLHGDSLTRASANAKIVNAAANFAALVLFAVRGTVVWSVAVPMAFANALGGWTGAHLAHHRGDRLVRGAVLVVVAVLVCKLALDLRR